MQRDILVNMIVKRLGNRRELVQHIINEMDLVMQTTLMQGDFVPRFLISELSEGRTVTSQERVAVPTNFFMEIEGAVLEAYHPTELKWKPLLKKDYDELNIAYDGIPDGFPEAYSLEGGYFRLRPIPNAQFRLRMFYYGYADSVLSGNAENAWLKYAPDLVLEATLQVMASKHTYNTKLAGEAEKSIKVAWGRLYKAEQAMKHVNKSYLKGEMP